jgi:hypothetical protein
MLQYALVITGFFGVTISSILILNKGRSKGTDRIIGVAFVMQIAALVIGGKIHP